MASNATESICSFLDDISHNLSTVPPVQVSTIKGTNNAIGSTTTLTQH